MIICKVTIINSIKSIYEFHYVYVVRASTNVRYLGRFALLLTSLSRSCRCRSRRPLCRCYVILRNKCCISFFFKYFYVMCGVGRFYSSTYSIHSYVGFLGFIVRDTILAIILIALF